MEDRMYTIVEAADILGVNPVTIRRTMAADIVRIGRVCRVPGAVLAQMLRSERAA